MCLGLPMTIIETDGISALCEFRGVRRRVSVLLLSSPPVHAKVLVHVDAAVRRLEDQEARLIADAIEGIGAALNGEACERFFSDLIDREPILPEHLRLDLANGHLRHSNTNDTTSAGFMETVAKLEDAPLVQRDDCDPVLTADFSSENAASHAWENI